MNLKKLSLAAVMISAALLTACTTSKSNTLHFTPASPTVNATFNGANQKAVVSVVTKDGRAQSEVSAYTSGGKLYKLNASPNVDQLFQQVMQQNLNARGFRVSSSGANTNLLVTVKDFYAQVNQGDLQYEINSKIQLEIHVQGANGNFTKNLGSTRTQKGALSADNDEIQTVLDENLKEVVNAIYQDQDIANAINQYSN